MIGTGLLSNKYLYYLGISAGAEICKAVEKERGWADGRRWAFLWVIVVSCVDVVAML